MADAEEESIMASYSHNRSRWQNDASKFTPQGILPRDATLTSKKTQQISKELAIKDHSKAVEVEDKSIILNYHINRSRWQNDSSKFTPKGILPRGPTPVKTKFDTSSTIGTSRADDILQLEDEVSISFCNSLRSCHSATEVQQPSPSDPLQHDNDLIEILDIAPHYPFYGKYFKQDEPEKVVQNSVDTDINAICDDDNNLKASEEVKPTTRQLSLGSFNLDEEGEWNRQTLLKQQQATKPAADESRTLLMNTIDRHRIFAEMTEEKNKPHSYNRGSAKTPTKRGIRVMDDNNMAKENILCFEDTLHGNIKYTSTEPLLRQCNALAQPNQTIQQNNQSALVTTVSPARSTKDTETEAGVLKADGATSMDSSQKTASLESPLTMSSTQAEQLQPVSLGSPSKILESSRTAEKSGLESPSRTFADHHAVERVELAIQERLAARKASKKQTVAREEENPTVASTFSDQKTEAIQEIHQPNSNLDREFLERSHHDDPNLDLSTLPKCSTNEVYRHSFCTFSDEEPFDIKASDFYEGIGMPDDRVVVQDDYQDDKVLSSDVNIISQKPVEEDLASDLNGTIESCQHDYDLTRMQDTNEGGSNNTHDDEEGDFPREMQSLVTVQHEKPWPVVKTEEKESITNPTFELFGDYHHCAARQLYTENLQQNSLSDELNAIWDKNNAIKTDFVLIDDKSTSTVSSFTRLSFDEDRPSGSFLPDKIISEETMVHRINHQLPSMHDENKPPECTISSTDVHGKAISDIEERPPLVEEIGRGSSHQFLSAFDNEPPDPLGPEIQSSKPDGKDHDDIIQVGRSSSSEGKKGYLSRRRRLQFIGRTRSSASSENPLERTESNDPTKQKVERFLRCNTAARGKGETDFLLATSLAVSASKITPVEHSTTRDDITENLRSKPSVLEKVKSDLEAPSDELKGHREAARKTSKMLHALAEDEVTVTNCIDEMKQFWEWAARFAEEANTLSDYTKLGSAINHGRDASTGDVMNPIGSGPELDHQMSDSHQNEIILKKAASEASQCNDRLLERLGKASDCLACPEKYPSLSARHVTAKQQISSKGESTKPNIVILSGCVLSRTSLKTIFMKKWKESFWIQFEATLMLFRSVADFKEWKSHQYTNVLEIVRGKNATQHEALVKFRVDFQDEMSRPGVRGFKTTEVKSKTYAKGGPLIYNFKLEKWMDLGPSILAAFASENPEEIEVLRHAIEECLQKCPENGLRSIKDLIVVETGKSNF